MILSTITADRIFCKICGTEIPANQTKCPNSKCSSNRPIHSKNKTQINNKSILAEI